MGDSLANNTSTISTLFSPTTPKLRSAAAIDRLVNHHLPAAKGEKAAARFSQDPVGHPHLSKSLNNLDVNSDANLAQTPVTPIRNVLPQLVKPTNIVEKSTLNTLWYDSSRSLMEQNTHENELILLRFKYFTFYDLSPKVESRTNA